MRRCVHVAVIFIYMYACVCLYQIVYMSVFADVLCDKCHHYWCFYLILLVNRSSDYDTRVHFMKKHMG